MEDFILRMGFLLIFESEGISGEIIFFYEIMEGKFLENFMNNRSDCE